MNRYKQIMWGLLTIGDSTYSLLMYEDTESGLSELRFRFALYLFDVNGEVFAQAVSAWWYNTNSLALYLKALVLVPSRRVLFAIMTDTLVRELYNSFEIRDASISHEEALALYESDGGLSSVVGDYSLSEYLRKREAARVEKYCEEKKIECPRLGALILDT